MVRPPHLDALTHQGQLTQALLPHWLPPPCAAAALAPFVRMLLLLLLQPQERRQLLCRQRLLFLTNSLLTGSGC
jgi:hypothetical protein